MRGVNDRNFLNAWQILYRASCPAGAETEWRVGDVAWLKQRHGFGARDYAFAIEVHRLRRAAGRDRAWTLLVTTEHWWDGAQTLVMSKTWARVPHGSARDIVAWMKEQEQR